MERDADGFVKRPRRWGWWVATLVLVASGVAFAVRASAREEERRAVAVARADYVSKHGMNDLHERVNRELVILGRRKASAKPTDKDMEVYRDARDAERVFVEACRRCAPAAECERDRLVIVAGRASENYNPCD